MAVQELLNGMWVPELRRQDPVINTSTYIMDATGEKVVLVFRAQKSGNLQGFGAYVGTVTNVPDNGLKFSFQSVATTTGQASGTILGATAGAHASTGAATPAAAGWLDPGNFSEVVAVNRGEIVAAVIEFSSFAASDSIAFGGAFVASNARGFPYAISATSTKNTATIPMFGIRYDDGSYVEIANDAWVATTLNQTTITTATSPNETGLKFQFDFPAVIDAVMWQGQISNNADYDIVFYDAAFNVIYATTVLGAVTSTTGTSLHEILLPSRVVLLPNVFYYVTIKPLTANNIVFFDYTFHSAALLDTAPGGSEWVLVSGTAASPGPSTEYTTRRPRIALRVGGIDVVTPEEVAEEVWTYFDRQLT